jgi:hypothetical protein
MNGFKVFYQTKFTFYFVLMNMEQWRFKIILYYYFKNYKNQL